MIEQLIEKGYAYVAEEHVLFHVAAMPDYGKLSQRSLDDMIAGARVEVAPYKRDPMDFVLWKPSKPGEPAWPSPCGHRGAGRPGWHIECSAMADKWLWTEALPRLSPEGRAHPHQFDIHGGGIDLVFPHHENEMAQSRSAHGTPLMAKYWMHNGFLQVEGKKMAKSEGNFVTIHELLQRLAGRGAAPQHAAHALSPADRLDAEGTRGEPQGARPLAPARRATPNRAVGQNPLLDKVLEPLLDDLNTPLAIAAIHHMAEEVADDHEGDDARCSAPRCSCSVCCR